MTNRNELITVGSKHEVFIEKMAHEGQGIGKINGKTIFVEEAIFSEKCLVEIVKVKKNYVIGKVVKIIKASPNRINPICLSAADCGGCGLQHMNYEAQLSFKTEKVRDSLKRIGHIDVEVLNTIGMKEPWYYRNKSQFPVGVIDGHGILGFYKKRSHEIVDVGNCLIQQQTNNEVLSVLKEWITKHNIPLYDEARHQGLLRHVVTRTAYKTGEIMVILVANGRDIPQRKELIELLKSKINGFKSLILNVNTKKTNVILGEENITIFGRPYIYDYISEIKFRLSPQSFFQVNPIQVEVLYNKVLEYAELTGSETVVDLYCGLGTITLFLAKKAKKVYGIEVVSEAIADARVNAQINNIYNVEFIEGAAEKIMPDMVKKGIKPDIIVVDPPRRGCHERTLEAITTVYPTKVIYVSCNPATLARDLRYLEDRGFKTIKVQPVDMFPQTHHVECVTLMSRVKD
ncbi:MAG TPA: 23S rRNA (uracil(1939)-C(5))-methyltransferase RlmD [Thermoanaerobacterales bacterium]|nr:23S rRNA (uracil(1939)-C(5))-methyltransferase RlmD [Thermoanaerobacterales bacterium]